MPDLTVMIVDSENEPVENVQVHLSIHHKWINHTWLRDTTDSSGEVVFDVPSYSKVDISVDDELEEEGFEIGGDDDDDEITISYSPYDDDDDDE